MNTKSQERQSVIAGARNPGASGPRVGPAPALRAPVSASQVSPR